MTFLRKTRKNEELLILCAWIILGGMILLFFSLTHVLSNKPQSRLQHINSILFNKDNALDNKNQKSFVSIKLIRDKKVKDHNDLSTISSVYSMTIDKCLPMRHMSYIVPRRVKLNGVGQSGPPVA